LHTYHIQHNLLETIIKAICNTETLSIKFLKVKAHTGIVGNERADQIAKHVANILKLLTPVLKWQGMEVTLFTTSFGLQPPRMVQSLNVLLLYNSNQSQPYQPHMRYLPNKRNAPQAHMHKVHKLGNAQTDASYYTYSQNLIENKSAHCKINNAFWSIPGFSHKEKETVIKFRSGMIYNQKHSSPSAPAKTVHFRSSQGAGIPS